MEAEIEFNNIDFESAIFNDATDQIERTPNELVWGLFARTLRDSPKTGLALDVLVPENWSTTQPICVDRPLEIIILRGQLRLNGIKADKGDFLSLEHGDEIYSASNSSAEQAHFLIFFDGGQPTSISASKTGNSLTHIANKSLTWVAGTAMEEAGREDVPLKIKHFKQHPITGARTYLIAVEPGVNIPWEMHDVAEEGYIVKGDFTLAERLPQGTQIKHYSVGGYFYRPPGIVHSGPESGTKSGAIMLIRTPGPLKVILID